MMGVHPHDVAARSVTQRSAGCTRLRQIISQLLALASQEPGFHQMVAMHTQITGLNIMDQEQMGSFICDVAGMDVSAAKFIICMLYV